MIIYSGTRGYVSITHTHTPTQGGSIGYASSEATDGYATLATLGKKLKLVKCVSRCEHRSEEKDEGRDGDAEKNAELG